MLRWSKAQCEAATTPRLLDFVPPNAPIPGIVPSLRLFSRPWGASSTLGWSNHARPSRNVHFHARGCFRSTPVKLGGQSGGDQHGSLHNLFISVGPYSLTPSLLQHTVHQQAEDCLIGYSIRDEPAGNCPARGYLLDVLKIVYLTGEYFTRHYSTGGYHIR